jgi:hypothetical protein
LKAYVNTPIVLYDEMCIICGDDDASGSFSRDHQDTPHVDTDYFDMGDDDSVMPDTQAYTSFDDSPQADVSPSIERSTNSGAKTKTGKHRLAGTEEAMRAIADRMSEVASSLLQLREEIVDKDALLEALLELQGDLRLTTSQVSKVFDVLAQNDKLGVAFLKRPIELRKAWIVDFIMENLSR